MTDDLSFTLFKLLGVFLLVLANGFFVAAEFSLVAVRRSRVQEMMAEQVPNAHILMRAVENLDAYLAATQLGITMSSLALGWLGEPALAHLVHPWLERLPWAIADGLSHGIAVAIAFTVITIFHIVLGELAPKSLALQRSEKTSLKTVRILEIYLFIFRPAIVMMNWLGNKVLKICGLRPGTSEGFLHSTEELKLLVAASQEAGLLEPEQQQVMDRVLSIGERRVRDIMTIRPDLIWVDIEDEESEIIRAIHDCNYDQIIVGRGSVNDVVGIVRKQDLFDQLIEGKAFNLEAVIKQPLIVHETLSILKVLEFFKKFPVHMALVLDEYGEIQGLVTQTDLLEALAGDLSSTNNDGPEIIEQKNGSLLMEGMISIYDAFDKIGLRKVPDGGDFHTLAGFVLFQFGRIPVVGEQCIWEGWRFEVMALDGRRIDKILISPISN